MPHTAATVNVRSGPGVTDSCLQGSDPVEPRQLEQPSDVGRAPQTTTAPPP